MLRKNIIASMLLLFTVSLVACNKGENGLATANKTETSVSTDAPKVEKNNSSDKQKLDTNYNITESNYSSDKDKLKFDIKYPQISGLSDSEKQKNINNILKAEALKGLKYYEKSDGSVDLNIGYNVILKNENILSIQYSGIGNVSNAAHPNKLFYTTNVNIKTGERVRLKDIINIDKSFADKFLRGKFKALWPEQSEELKQFTNEQIQELFKEADSLDNIGTEKQSDVFCYFTKDSLGISISVSYAMGGHAEFEINYQDIKDNIKSENGIWNEILK